MECINNGGKILCLVGRWGSGKRSTAKQVYVYVTKSSPIIVSNLLTFDAKEHHEPIIVDMTLSIGMPEKENLTEKMHMLFENMSTSKIYTKAFIIFLIDEDRERIAKYVRSLGKETKFIDISKSFTKGDRTQVLYSQFDTFCRHKNFSKFEKLANENGKEFFLGYSEICALFCRCTYFQTVHPVLFRNRPLVYLKSYLEKMHKTDEREKFLILVYMSLNQMEINVNSQNDILSEILESCVPTRKETKSGTKQIEITATKVTLETSNTEHASSSESKHIKRIRSREDIISLIPMEFVNKVPGASVYRLQHDVIKRMALIVFGTYHFDTLLKYSKPEELKPWVKEKKMIFNMSQGEIEPVLEIDRGKWLQNQCQRILE